METIKNIFVVIKYAAKMRPKTVHMINYLKKTRTQKMNDRNVFCTSTGVHVIC